MYAALANLGILLCTAMMLSFRLPSLRIFCFLYIIPGRLRIALGCIIGFFLAQRSWMMVIIDICKNNNVKHKHTHTASQHDTLDTRQEDDPYDDWHDLGVP